MFSTPLSFSFICKISLWGHALLDSFTSNPGSVWLLSIIVIPVKPQHGFWSCCMSPELKIGSSLGKCVCDDKKSDRVGTLVSGWARGKMRKITGCHCRWDMADKSHFRLPLLGISVGIGKKRTMSTGLWANLGEPELSVYLFGTTPGNGHSGLYWKLTLKPLFAN